MTTNSYSWVKWVLPIVAAGVIALIPSLIGYGVMTNRVEAGEKKTNTNTVEIKENREAIRRLETGQVEIKTKLDSEVKTQDGYRARTENSLGRILDRVEKLKTGGTR